MTDEPVNLVLERLKARRAEFAPAMEERAAAMGANAIVGVDLDDEALGSDGSMLMVSASGTAVSVA